MMKKGLRNVLSRWAIYGLALCLAVVAAPKLSTADDDDDRDRDRDEDSRPAVRPPDGDRIRPQKPERELREMIRDIDRRNIQATITKLVSFGTRHTESSMTDPNQGIGAAI